MNLLIASIAGIAIIYSAGAFLLYLNLNFLAKNSTPIGRILQIGIYPFIFPDLLKAGVASLLTVKIRRRLKNSL